MAATSFAFIFGVLPLYFATGAGQIGRPSVGTAIVGGMLFSTVLPVLYPGTVRHHEDDSHLVLVAPRVKS